MKCPCCGIEGIVPLIQQPGKHLDLATGIWPVAEWGHECGRGFVTDLRFAGRNTVLVIKRSAGRKKRSRAKGL